jgi:fructokinase
LSPRPVIFGEILFDCFPDGARIFSGAPLNVCRNLKYLGYDPLMISRIGTDALGEIVLAEMQKIELDTSGVQIDPAHATGMVVVTLEDSEPQFEIALGQAWDFIDADEAIAAVDAIDVSFVYSGSLALRQDPSRRSFYHMLDQLNAPLFFDVNLRQEWWSEALINDLVGRATWLKCNADEYARLFGEAAPQLIREKFELEVLIQTRGGDGAAIAFANALVEGSPPELVAPLQDTVGSGDAFASMVIAGLDAGHAPEAILEAALLKGAEVACIRGADWKA